MGLLQALIDAVHGEDNRIAGGALSLLSSAISESAASIPVETTIGFGEFSGDGAGDALFAVGDEVVYATGRTLSSFTGCSRGARNTAAAVHGQGARVVDLARNTSALDLVRRGLLVSTAVGGDLDVVGRNLGLHRCPGLSQEQWRAEIKAVAYLPKQPVAALRAALDAVFPGQYDLYERLATRPSTVFVRIDIPAARSLRGRFFLNGGEPQVVTGGQVTVNYPIVGAPFDGAAARGSLRCVSGFFLVDGEQFVLDDGNNPAVTFEFDSDGSVVETSTLRAVNFAASDSEATVRAAVIAAISGAPALGVLPSAAAADQCTVLLENAAAGVAGNVAITDTVADPVFAVDGMAGGQDAGSFGVFAVVEDDFNSRRGYRLEGVARYDVASFAGSVVTLSTPPPDGTAVLVDYTSFDGHYLPPNVLFRNEGDVPPYFADDLGTARCILDLVRAAGVGVEVGVRSFTV